jgi:hypothetical protein
MRSAAIRTRQGPAATHHHRRHRFAAGRISCSLFYWTTTLRWSGRHVADERWLAGLGQLVKGVASAVCKGGLVAVVGVLGWCRC